MEKNGLKVNLGGINLKNSVILASGTFGYGEEVSDSIDLNKLGGFVTKTVTPKPRKGNPPPRIYDLGFGLVNSVGMENPGLQEFKDEKMVFLKSLKTKVFVSLYSDRASGWEKMVSGLNKEDIAGFELNLSCPNIEGEIISASVNETKKVVASVRKNTSKPVIAKLSFSPQVKDISIAAEKAGADAVTLINTIPAMALDPKAKKPVLGNRVGGLSGPCIKPVALRAVYEASSELSIPVVGCGGIMSCDDVEEFFAVGAKAVQLGTANIIDPFLCLDIIEKLEGRG